MKMGVKKRFKILGIALLGGVFAIFLPHFADAEESPKIYFSEVMFCGSSNSPTYDKWVELYNAGDSVVDLASWSVFDYLKNKNIAEIDDGLIAPKGHFLIARYNKDNDPAGEKSILNIEPDFAPSSFGFAKNLKLSLKNDSGAEVDFIGDGKTIFSKSCPTVSDDSSFYSSIERTDFTKTDISAWALATQRKNLDTTAVDFATPESSGRPVIESLLAVPDRFARGSPINLNLQYDVRDLANDLAKIKVSIFNEELLIEDYTADFGATKFSLGQISFCPKIMVTFYDTVGLWRVEEIPITCYTKSSDIKFTEVLPHPKLVDFNADGKLDTDDEFFVITSSDPNSIILDGWSVVDKSGKKFPLNGLSIQPGEELKIFKTQSGISINDAGEKTNDMADKLFLYDPEGVLIDSVEVPNSSSKFDKKYILQNGIWGFEEEEDAPENVSPVEPATETATPASTDIKTVDPVPAAASDSTDPAQTIILTVKTTHTNSSILSSRSSPQISPIVLGAIDKQPSTPFSWGDNLLSFLGVLIFFEVVVIYEICR